MARTTRSLAMLVTVVLATVASGGLAAAGGIGDGSTAVGSASVAAQAECSYPVTVTDVTGTEVTLEDRPERIVVIQPSDAQIVWSLNASDRVVGMPQGPTTGYLNDTANVTNIKNQDGTVDVEQVTNQSADLVLAANVTRSDTVNQLRESGQTVYHFGQVSSMAETYRNINTTGQLVGNCEEAADTVDSMQTRLDRIHRAVADEDQPRVLYDFWGYTAANDTHINSMIELAGGQNVYANQSGYPQLNQEFVVAQDPQWIVQPTGAPVPKGDGYNSTTAIQNDQRLTVDDNYVSQAGPRVVTVVETMAKAFHPDAFDENGDPIVETPTPTPTMAATDTSTPMSTTAAGGDASDTPATTEGAGPGFPPVVVLLALIGAVLGLGVRRKGV